MTGLLFSPFATFLLGIAALMKLVLHMQNPIKRNLEQYEGKTEYQVEAEIGKAVRKDCRSVTIGLLSRAQYIFLILLFAFVIDPILVATAIIRNIGYQPFAWVMVVVVALTCYIWIRNYYLAIKANNGEHVDEAEMGLVPYKWVLLADKIRLSQSARYWIRRIFPSLSDLYFWYLLLVVLGVLH